MSTIEQAELGLDMQDAPLASAMRGTLQPGRRAAYVLAGKATLTIRSTVTGTRFTFKVTASKPRPGVKPEHHQPVYFVNLLSGSDNTSDYQYIGTIFSNGFRTTRASRVSEQAPSVQAFAWLTRHWEDARIEVWHEGRCGKCGRALTVPESIDSGLGPICAEK